MHKSFLLKHILSADGKLRTKRMNLILLFVIIYAFMGRDGKAGLILISGLRTFTLSMKYHFYACLLEITLKTHY